jgi:dimethylhistidine N-methyltransferase
MHKISPRKRFRLVATPVDARLSAFAKDVRMGLTSQPKSLPCCYFYDQQGSLLFEEICDLPEYYLPRAEEEILRARAAEIVARFPNNTLLVELGSGNSAKTRLLIEALLQNRDRLCYVPIDICRAMLEDTSLLLLRDYPGLEIIAVAGEYQQGLQHFRTLEQGAKLILWLGSNIGNFTRPEAAAFLTSVRATMQKSDRLLVGIDLRKDPCILESAYADSRGITAQFNLNILRRINNELGGHFDLGRFRHRSVYNEEVGRIEMYLDSLADQTVGIDALKVKIAFAADEPVFTESSFKYSPKEISYLANAAGLAMEDQWLDSQNRFSVNLLVPLQADVGPNVLENRGLLADH